MKNLKKMIAVGFMALSFCVTAFAATEQVDRVTNWNNEADAVSFENGSEMRLLNSNLQVGDFANIYDDSGRLLKVSKLEKIHERKGERFGEFSTVTTIYEMNDWYFIAIKNYSRRGMK